MRAQRRPHREDNAPQEDPTVVAQRRHRRVGVGIGAAFLFIIAGVVALGYYQEFYKPPRVWAGSVRNVEFTMGDLVDRIRVLQGLDRRQGGRVDLGRVPFEILEELIDAEILRQESHVLGIDVTDDDIERELRRLFTPTADPGQETDPGQLEREFENNYVSFLTDTTLSDGDYRVIVEESIASSALRFLLSQEIEDPQPQVEIQWIRLSLESEILPNDVVKRLENEDFTRVAQELNTASPFAGADGYVDWVPQGAFPELDATIFGIEEEGVEPLPTGKISEPIFSNDGFVLIKVLSGAEDRELEATMFVKLAVELVEKWQQDASASGRDQGFVRMNFGSKLYAWVADQVLITAPRVDR